MLDSGEHETAVKGLAADTYGGLISTNSEVTMDLLNPRRVSMRPLPFAPKPTFRWASWIC